MIQWRKSDFPLRVVPPSQKASWISCRDHKTPPKCGMWNSTVPGCFGVILVLPSEKLTTERLYTHPALLNTLGYHDNVVNILFPSHFPEIILCARQRSLSCNVFPTKIIALPIQETMISWDSAIVTRHCFPGYLFLKHNVRESFNAEEKNSRNKKMECVLYIPYMCIYSFPRLEGTI